MAERLHGSNEVIVCAVVVPGDFVASPWSAWLDREHLLVALALRVTLLPAGSAPRRLPSGAGADMGDVRESGPLFPLRSQGQRFAERSQKKDVAERGDLERGELDGNFRGEAPGESSERPVEHRSSH